MVGSKILDEMREKPAACYVLTGDDSFLKDEFLKDVKSLLPPETAGFNYDVFRAGAGSARDVISAALSYPAGSELRVVVVKDCREFNEEDRQAILSYIGEPSGHTLLLLDFDRPPASKAFYKKLLSGGREIKFRVKTRGGTAAWLKERAARSGKKLSADALASLQSSGGGNLRLLANELDRLCLQSGDREEITGRDAGFSASGPAKRTGFELGSAISSGNCPLALRVLNDLNRSDDAAAEMLLGSLAWHFRAVWKVGAALRAGTAPGKLASACGIPPFRVQEFRRCGAKYSDEVMAKIFRELLSTDLKLKTRQSSALDLELLVVRLCGLTPP